VAWTADDLDTAVRLRGRLPTGSSALSTAQVLSLADDEILGVIWPLLHKRRGNYGVRHEDQAIAANVSAYRMPALAVGATNRVVCYVDADGDEAAIAEVPLEERGDWESGGSGVWDRGLAFCVEGDRIILLPTPTTATGSIRIKYQRRPPKLIAAASCVLVTSISNTYRYNGTVPASWTTATIVDVLESRPNFDLLLSKKTPTSVTTGSGYVTLADLADTDGITAGIRSLTTPEMYVAPTGYSPVVGLPDVLHPALVSLTTAVAMESLGDAEAGNIARADGMRKLEVALASLSPRGTGMARKVVSRSTPLRWGRQ
jgi:hypothetical protein